MNPDTLTLDQLRLFIAVVDEGGFAAAGRALGRSQSSVSYAISNLEGNLEVPLFDRTIKRHLTLTSDGQALVHDARRVLEQLTHFGQKVSRLKEGEEQELVLAVDMHFPMAALVELCQSFHDTYPQVTLRVFSEALGAVSQRVLMHDNAIGVQGPDGLSHDMAMSPLNKLSLVCVVSPAHPLAIYEGHVPTALLHQHHQIILTDRSDGTQHHQQAILNPTTKQWHTADLHTKHELIRAGLGWGNLPLHQVQDDLRQERLRRIRPEAWQHVQWQLPLYAIWPRTAQLGPVATWVLAQLEGLCKEHLREDVS